MTAAHEDHAFPSFVEMNAEGQPTAIETGMTLRQYAAIKLRVPNSGTDWLDEMIHQSLRDELAAKAMQGLISNDQDYEVWGDWIENGFEDRQSIVNVYAEAAYEIAGALLKAQKAPQ